MRKRAASSWSPSTDTSCCQGSRLVDHARKSSVDEVIIARGSKVESVPGARWFLGARLNWAENLLRQGADDRTTIVGPTEGREPAEMTWDELTAQVASLAAELRALGVRPGDRVAAYLPNIPQAVVALLATASIGAIWSCCSTDFGTKGVIDRFRQIEPTC